MALPNSNISVAMVKAELGASTNDVGRLCIHPNINKWSKLKPIRHSKKHNVLPSDFKDSNYGFDIPSSNTGLVSVLSSPWKYLIPIGGESSPYRIGDFRGYSHDANRPGKFLIPASIELSGGSPVDFTITLRSMISTSDGVSLTDVLEDKFFGVLVKRGTSIAYKTTNQVITNGNDIQINASDCPLINSEGTVEVYCFAADSIITSWVTVEGGVYIYSLNLEGGISYKTVSISDVTPVFNTFAIYYSGFQLVDRFKVALDYNASMSGSGIVSDWGTINDELTYSYTLRDITLRVKKQSDNSIVFTDTYLPDSNTSPTTLSPFDGTGDIIFSCSDYKSYAPALGYSIEYTFNFVKD